MSKHLYTFLPTGGLSSTARTVHLLTSYWGLVLMSLHAGTHLDRMTAGLRKNRRLGVISAAAVSLIAAYGIYAFVRLRFAEYMFLRTRFVFFDFDRPRALFVIDILSVIILFAWAGYLIKKALDRAGVKRGA